MRQFIEFVPIVLFAVIYFWTRDIYIATAVLMLGVCVQVGFEYYQDKTVSKRTISVFLIVILAGAATLLFQDELFIKWKPTAVNWLFSVALLGGHLFSKDNFLKKLLNEHVALPDLVWRNLNFGWALGFFIAGALNLFVAYGYNTEIWVTYKLVGGVALTICYMMITILYLTKGGYLSETDRIPKD